MRALLPEPIPNLNDTQLLAQYRWPEALTPEHPLPWVRMNFAASADGSVAGNGALSASVSGPADKRVFSLLRATCDAVVVGAGTARAEKYGPVKVRPSMQELRRSQGRTDPPALVLVTANAELNPESEMFTKSVSRTIVVTSAAAPHDRRRALAEVADVLICGDELVDLTVMVNELAKRGLERLLGEGGPQLFASMLAASQVDDLCLTISPLLVGGIVLGVTGIPHPPSRITAGPPLFPNPLRLSLRSLIEADSFLMTLYQILNGV